MRCHTVWWEVRGGGGANSYPLRFKVGWAWSVVMGNPVYYILYFNIINVPIQPILDRFEQNMFDVCSHSHSIISIHYFHDRLAINILIQTVTKPGGYDSSSCTCTSNKDRLPFQIGHLYSVLYGWASFMTETDTIKRC